MEIENIALIICIWDNGLKLGSQALKGGELFKVIIERAKDLLGVIHNQIVQNEIDKKRMLEDET